MEKEQTPKKQEGGGVFTVKNEKFGKFTKIEVKNKNTGWIPKESCEVV